MANLLGLGEEVLLAAQAAATLYLTGLIWFVQIAHYPLFDRVGAQAFPRYHGAYTPRTTWVVGPPMMIEAVTCAATALWPPSTVPVLQAWLGLALVVVIWVSTATLQIPQHRRLAEAFDAAAHRRLVSTNWIRTVAWTMRAGLVLAWLSNGTP